MPLFRTCPFEELVVRATNENNINDDWALILEICDKAVNYEEGSKLILQAITKRLYHNVPRVVMQALLLLDACVKNCGRRFHLEVSSRNFTAEIRKLLQKMNPGTVDKFKALIKRWAEVDFKDDSELGLIPSLYYKLKSEGVQFPEEVVEAKPLPPPCTNPDAVSTQQEEEDIVKAITLSLKETKHNNTNGSIYDMKALYEPAKELVKVRALYDFEAVEDNELTIKAGEIIVVIDKSNDSWWKGSNQRGEGYFPTSFVTEDLNAKIEFFKTVVPETSPADEEDTIEKPIVIDEEKIEKTLNLLNETDPTDDYADNQNLREMERECYAMSPLIDEKLHDIDKKCTVLNALNDDIMKAIDSFYKLTRDTAIPNQYNYFYPPEAMHLSMNPQYSMTPRPIHPDGSALYMAPNYLANLASNQIRQNMANLPFIHPSQYIPSHYNTVPQKFCVDPRLNFPYMPDPQFMKPNNSDENIENSNLDIEQPPNSVNSTNTPNYSNLQQSSVSEMPSQNVPSTLNPNNVTQSTAELQAQQFFTQAPTSTIVATHTIGEPNKIPSAIVSNIQSDPYMNTHPDTVNAVSIANERHSDNLNNQAGSIL